MRWFWIDRFTEFVSGSHARGYKNVTLAEEALDEYCPGYPMLPPTLIIEGMAQMGGILVSEHFQFDKHVVLAKVGKAKFHQTARNGDQLSLAVDLDAVQDTGATVTCLSHSGDQLQAEIDLMFAFFGGWSVHGRSTFQSGHAERHAPNDEFFPRGSRS